MTTDADNERRKMRTITCMDLGLGELKMEKLARRICFDYLSLKLMNHSKSRFSWIVSWTVLYKIYIFNVHVDLKSKMVAITGHSLNGTLRVI